MDHAAALTVYERLAERHDDVAIKGKANKYTSMNGNMFSFLTKDGMLCLRFAEDGREAFDEKHGTSPVIQHNSVMRGYVGIPDSMMDDADVLADYFERCVAFAATIPPKPTKKPKK